MPPPPGSPEPWMQQALQEGYTRLAQGDRQGAADCCRRVLTVTPDLAEGHFLVGLVAAESNDLGTAVQAFGSVTKLNPAHGAAWAQLGRLFMRLGHVNRADDALASAVKNQDGNPLVQDTIATVYTLLGDTEAAATWLHAAVAQQPRNVALRINQANNQMFTGDFDAARRSLQYALAEQPENANAHWLLSGLGRATDDSHVQQLQNLLQRARDNPRDRAYLGYALGKELEDLEQWPEAFAAYATGAEARRVSLSYNESAEIAMFRALQQTFDQSWLERQAPGCDDPAPVFIVGQPRTGTTLVERIITSHSMVHSAGELRQFDSSLRRLLNYRGRERHSAELVTAAAGMDLRRLGEAYLSTSRKFQGTLPRFVDKLPTNYRYLPLILAALPNAKIIHLRRDPMDACFASFKQLFAEAYPHSYRQEEMARHHARYLRLMSCWRERFGDRFHEVRYEDVAANLEPNARALIDFLGLPWEPACLEFHRQASAVTTASVVQVREAAHTRSVGRWRRYAEQLQPMRRALAAEGVDVD
ncbi:sulfotransferase [Haliea sp. E1-2-M8]|uniref:tetratricopeptide repeat-containing sulfotransferase family protein n=1 Tax=Haliea sp. E1-2-M8 TaxID=3064706 RepID=UPI00271DBC39|nr:tetratricopeptide repeat-containing sulfotransferase family protein [Haliea sp. E1-2-M8]MDO8861145.1 sulfotransferase [Haliea sp. E1-2-M8]